jgi:hypothetical protein
MVLFFPAASGSLFAVCDTAGLTEGGVMISMLRSVLQPTLIAAFIALVATKPSEAEAPLRLLHAMVFWATAAMAAITAFYCVLYVADTPLIYDIVPVVNLAYYALSLMVVSVYRLILWGD